MKPKWAEMDVQMSDNYGDIIEIKAIASPHAWITFLESGGDGGFAMALDTERLDTLIAHLLYARAAIAPKIEQTT